MPNTTREGTMDAYAYINYAAARLGEDPFFQSGGPYRLYTGVPIGCIRREGQSLVTRIREDPSSSQALLDLAADNNAVLDLVVCKGREILRGLILTMDTWRRVRVLTQEVEWMDNMLHVQVFTMLPQHANYAVNTLLNDLKSARPPAESPIYTLEAMEVTAATAISSPKLEEQMDRARLLTRKGELTGYAKACGLFLEHDLAEKTTTFMVEPHQAGTLREILTRGETKGLTLNQRLRRLDASWPSDERYGAFLADALNKLLRTPLDELCQHDSQALESMTEMIDAGRKLMGKGSLQSPTYGSALKTVRDFLRESHYRPDLREQLQRAGNSLLAMLARQLLRPKEVPKLDANGPTTLQERLRILDATPSEDDRVNPYTGKPYDEDWACYLALEKEIRSEEFPILHAPLAHYYYAAAELDGSNYPMWYLSDRMCGGKQPTTNYFAFLVKRALGEVPGDSNRSNSLLYSLLVEPIFPSMGTQSFPWMLTRKKSPAKVAAKPAGDKERRVTG